MRQLLLVCAVATLGCGSVSFGDRSAGTDSTSSSSAVLDECRRNCSTGCCTNDGVCMSGLATDACGKTGALCVTCPEGGGCMKVPGGGECQGGTTSSGNSTAFENCKRNCNSGCCTQDGTCQPGTSEAVCGASGNLCVSCPSGERCELSASGGRCQPCNPFNCAGCCASSGECLAGTADSACGQGGETCVSCPGYCSSWSTGGGRCQ